jgi:hypothetical protein
MLPAKATIDDGSETETSNSKQQLNRFLSSKYCDNPIMWCTGKLQNLDAALLCYVCKDLYAHLHFMNFIIMKLDRTFGNLLFLFVKKHTTWSTLTTHHLFAGHQEETPS